MDSVLFCVDPEGSTWLFYTDLSMSYVAAVEQLNAMVPELYQSSGQPRRKFSLDEIRILLAALGDPHRRFPNRFRGDGSCWSD